jgi:methionine synthase II (cobalamin-independent)
MGYDRGPPEDRMFATLLGAYPAATEPMPDDELVRAVVADLEAAGLEPLTDGQVRRRSSLAGWPIDPDAVVADWRFAAASTERAVKQSLPGPYTIARDGLPARRHSAGPIERPQSDRDLAEAPASAALAGERLREVVVALAAAGCPLVEIEEPAAIRIGDDETERRQFLDAHRRLADGLAGLVHLSLVVTGGNADTAGSATFFDLPYASYAFDLIAGPDNWRLIAEAPGDRGIVCGALDPSEASSDGPEMLVWAAHYAASTGGRGLDRVGLANASSLVGLGRDVARRKLGLVAEAARIAAAASPDDLAGLLDPRAVGRRSGARGRPENRPDGDSGA